MHDRLKNLALIPARGDSKRLPGKNWRVLGDKPLVSHTIESAIESNCFDKIILSTDNDKIAEIGKKYPDITIDSRSDELASDTATVREVALDLMKRYEESGESYDTLTLLLPTALFRKSQDLINGFSLLTLNEDIDTVISVTPYDFPPQKGVVVDSDGTVCPVWPDSPLISGKTRTQDQQYIYHENGIFFICRWKSFIKNKSYYIGKTKAYIIQDTVDVDTESDFRYAQFLIDTEKHL